MEIRHVLSVLLCSFMHIAMVVSIDLQPKNTSLSRTSSETELAAITSLDKHQVGSQPCVVTPITPRKACPVSPIRDMVIQKFYNGFSPEELSVIARMLDKSVQAAACPISPLRRGYVGFVRPCSTPTNEV